MALELVVGMFFLGKTLIWVGYFLGIEPHPVYLLKENINTLDAYSHGKSNDTEKVAQQKSTLATHDESFISGMMWSDVGRGS
jgi:hypothetical protein